jgi:hypothetical protein
LNVEYDGEVTLVEKASESSDSKSHGPFFAPTKPVREGYESDAAAEDTSAAAEDASSQVELETSNLKLSLDIVCISMSII